MDPEEYLKGIDRLVRQHGVAIQFVGAGEAKSSFGYTVGLFLVSHPELILFGLPSDLTKRLLNDLAFSVLRGGMGYAEGDRVHQLLQGYAVRLGPVSDPDQHLGVAFATARLRGLPATDVRALQVHLPDPSGSFMGDEGFTGPDWPALGPLPAVSRDQTLPEDDQRRAQGW